MWHNVPSPYSNKSQSIVTPDILHLCITFNAVGNHQSSKLQQIKPIYKLRKRLEWAVWLFNTTHWEIYCNHYHLFRPFHHLGCLPSQVPSNTALDGDIKRLRLIWTFTEPTFIQRTDTDTWRSSERGEQSISKKLLSNPYWNSSIKMGCPKPFQK